MSQVLEFKPKSIWKRREVRLLDHTRLPLRTLLSEDSAVVRETTTPLKDRTIADYPAASIIAITEGRSRYIVSGVELVVEAPSVMIRPGGSTLRHLGDAEVDCSSKYFCLMGGLASYLDRMKKTGEPCVYFEGRDELFVAICEAVDTAFLNESNSEWMMASKLMQVYQLLEERIPILRDKDHVGRRLDSAVGGDWSLPRSADDAAKLLGLSRSELYRQFQDETGSSPAEWIRRRRMELAEVHLKNGLNVSEVADLLHCSSPYALSRMFKEQTGKRPKEIKRIASGS